uniref:SAM-dependent MTase RsmB/NOP-type domain-containing protein n=1 Tax=Monopterus albus TaxID=43700 RepID=A0A3Q3K638_MONAL
MFAAHQLHGARRIFCGETEKLTSISLWWFFSCHTGSEVVLQPYEQKGAPNNQASKNHKKERASCQPVLDHFDQQYSQELGELWESARSVLLDPHSWQYGVMLNRFTAVTEITQILQSQGFSRFLLRTDVSTLLSDGPSPVSNSKYQAHRPGHLKQYYLLNAASLLPVLALQVRDGEKVLDLCSAPGGKALAIMQCATPALLCCNEPDPHRRDWLAKTLESYLPHSLNSRVIVSAQDGRHFGHSEALTYDKVLVDAPCSNDRSWLYSCSSQQGEQRLRGRAKLPVLQAQLLRSALSAVRPGGVVVYSTCTLSSSENYAVVETVLNDCPETEPEDLWEEIAIPLSKYFVFSAAHLGHGQTPYKPSLQPQNSTVSSYHHRLGILVVPQPGMTWGPMFLSRIRRKK